VIRALPIIAALSIAAAGAHAAPAPQPVLVIRDMTFVAPGQPLTAGETLRVRNDDVFLHSATVKGEFSLDLKPGKSGRVVLKHAGMFEVTCRFHPTMKAKLSVQPAPAHRKH